MPEKVPLYRGSPSLEHRGIPEAADLTWEDTFFDRENRDALIVGSPNVIAVFDFDYTEMEQYDTKRFVAMNCPIAVFGTAYIGCFGAAMTPYSMMGGCLGTSIVPGLYGLFCPPCMISQQVRWTVQSKHVAITEDGIRFVQDKYKTCWGLAMSDQPKTSQMFPFEQIIDCDVIEPVGNECLCVPRTLFTVSVTTLSHVQRVVHLTGLKEPYKFCRLVWALKRSKMSGAATYLAPTNVTMYAERGIPSCTDNAAAGAGKHLDMTPSTQNRDSLLVAAAPKSQSF